MIPSQDVIAQVADRIERAYLRKHPHWMPLGTTSGVWAAAAMRLLDACEADPELPADPEMFVAVQKPGRLRPDPWMELAQPQAQHRFKLAIRQVVARLRRELRAEIRLGELRALRGESLERVVTTAESRVSPLAQYIIALRAGRSDLAELVRRSASEQDRSCPLYRQAARALLAPGLYPRGGETPADMPGSNQNIIFSLN